MSIRAGLLALLTEAPKYGYQLKQDFEQRTAGVWTLNVGQVYTTLDRLERDERIEPGDTDDEGRRRYTITDAGRVELDGWFTEPVPDVPARDELLLKVLLALDPEAADELVDPLEVIDTQRDALTRQLQAHRRSQRQAASRDGHGLTASLVFDALIARVEADLRWLDLCEERLVEHTRSTATRGNGRRATTTRRTR